MACGTSAQLLVPASSDFPKRDSDPDIVTSFGRAIAAVIWVLALAEYPIEALAQETAGERFRKVMAQIDENCRERKLGPYLDRSDPEYRQKQALTNCDILKLEPRDWRTEKMVQTAGQHYPVPERWLATPEGRFAHSIRLPAPHDKPKDVYRPGMTGREYFEALCREEAGEFVFRRVPEAKGVLRARAPVREVDDLLRHLFAPEAPLGLALWQAHSSMDDLGQTLVQPNHGRLAFAETVSWAGSNRSVAGAFRRFERDPERATGRATNYTPAGGTISVPNEVVEIGVLEPSARYAFTWRGIARPFDREHGIAGGELIVYDRETSEVLGLRRAFRVTEVGRRGAWWLSSGNCTRELSLMPVPLIYQVLSASENDKRRISGSRVE